jgi:hypothetical protein
MQLNLCQTFNESRHHLIRVLPSLNEDDCHAFDEGQEITRLVLPGALEHSCDHRVEGIYKVLLLNIEGIARPHIYDLEGAQEAREDV